VSIFKKIGKFFKKVAKVALPVLKLGVGFIPGVGGLAAKALSLGSVQKGMHIAGQIKKAGRTLKKTLPGGAAAQLPPPAARVAQPVAIHPLVSMKHKRTIHKVAHMAKRRSATTKKRKPSVRRAAKKRAPARRGRKLKFGSPAWRKKYIKKRRR